MGRITDIYDRLVDLELRLTALENTTIAKMEAKPSRKKKEEEVNGIEDDVLEGTTD